jgi:hypothetical protein
MVLIWVEMPSNGPFQRAGLIERIRCSNLRGSLDRARIRLVVEGGRSSGGQIVLQEQSISNNEKLRFTSRWREGTSFPWLAL